MGSRFRRNFGLSSRSPTRPTSQNAAPLPPAQRRQALRRNNLGLLLTTICMICIALAAWLISEDALDDFLRWMIGLPR